MKVVLFATVGICGMDAAELMEFPDSITEEELNKEAEQFAIDNAETYGYYPLDEYSEHDDDEYYVDSIEGWWEYYIPDVHDGVI